MDSNHNNYYPRYLESPLFQNFFLVYKGLWITAELNWYSYSMQIALFIAEAKNHDQGSLEVVDVLVQNVATKN